MRVVCESYKFVDESKSNRISSDSIRARLAQNLIRIVHESYQILYGLQRAVYESYRFLYCPYTNRARAHTGRTRMAQERPAIRDFAFRWRFAGDSRPAARDPRFCVSRRRPATAARDPRFCVSLVFHGCEPEPIRTRTDTSPNRSKPERMRTYTEPNPNGCEPELWQGVRFGNKLSRNLGCGFSHQRTRVSCCL